MRIIFNCEGRGKMLNKAIPLHEQIRDGVKRSR